MTAVIFGAVVLLTAAFAFLNGFRDVSTSVALAVRTRALTPSVAVLLAAFFNFVGALLSATLAVAVSQTLDHPARRRQRPRHPGGRPRSAPAPGAC